MTEAPVAQMINATVNPYDLFKGFHCEECGQPKTLRMYDRLSGCATCDEVRGRHRCIGRPLPFDLAEGAEWTCEGCGAVYRVQVEIEEIEHRTWAVASPALREEPRAEDRCHRSNGYDVHVQPGCRCNSRRLGL